MFGQSHKSFWFVVCNSVHVPQLLMVAYAWIATLPELRVLRVNGLNGVVQDLRGLDQPQFPPVHARGLHTLATLRSLSVLELSGCVPDPQQDEPLSTSLAPWQPLMPGLEVLLLDDALTALQVWCGNDAWSLADRACFTFFSCVDGFATHSSMPAWQEGGMFMGTQHQWQP